AEQEGEDPEGGVEAWQVDGRPDGADADQLEGDEVQGGDEQQRPPRAQQRARGAADRQPAYQEREGLAGRDGPARQRQAGDDARRSEEHTSELQSRENLVCRLLLEKKKKNNNNKTTQDT